MRTGIPFHAELFIAFVYFYKQFQGSQWRVGLSLTTRWSGIGDMNYNSSCYCCGVVPHATSCKKDLKRGRGLFTLHTHQHLRQTAQNEAHPVKQGTGVRKWSQQGSWVISVTRSTSAWWHHTCMLDSAIPRPNKSSVSSLFRGNDLFFAGILLFFFFCGRGRGYYRS